MQFDHLGPVERKVLGALLILANDRSEVTTRLKDIANTMGYKQEGGAITFAIRILERENYLVKTGKSRYKLLV